MLNVVHPFHFIWNSVPIVICMRGGSDMEAQTCCIISMCSFFFFFLVRFFSPLNFGLQFSFTPLLFVTLFNLMHYAGRVLSAIMICFLYYATFIWFKCECLRRQFFVCFAPSHLLQRSNTLQMLIGLVLCGLFQTTNRINMKYYVKYQLFVYGQTFRAFFFFFSFPIRMLY